MGGEVTQEMAEERIMHVLMEAGEPIDISDLQKGLPNYRPKNANYGKALQDLIYYRHALITPARKITAHPRCRHYKSE